MSQEKVEESLQESDQKCDKKVSTDLSRGPTELSESALVKWIRTVFLICTWIAQGLFMELAGPTLKDLILKSGSNYEDIADAVSAQGVGVFIGCVVAGFAVDKFSTYLNLILAVFLTGSAITVSGIPWVTNLRVLWCMYLILGVCHGSVNLAGQRQVLLIWGKKAASPMNIVHLGYGVGAFLAPLLANPFLADVVHMKKSINASNVTYSNISMRTNSSGIEEPKQVSHIEHAYLIVGCLTIGLSTVFYIQQMLDHRTTDLSTTRDRNTKAALDTKRKFKEMINPATCADGNLCYGMVVLLLLFLRHIWLAGWDRMLGTFLRSYAIDQLQFSNDDASYLNTVFWACYAGGRFFGFLIARFFSVKFLLIGQTSTSSIISILLLIFGRDYSVALWVLIVTMGFSLGPLYPTGVAWGNNAIEITGLAIGVLQFGTSTGALIFIKSGGVSYGYYGPTALVYTLFIVGVGIFINDILLTLVFVNKRRLFTEHDITGIDRSSEVEEKIC